MEHTEIRRTLSAYLDNAVSPDEKAEIEAHLARCGSCRVALGDLERTVGHLKSLPEVEPPPWLTARIMAHVRDAAEPQPSLWRRIFLPLRAKLPLEALALVFLCVTGYYLARTNAPLVQLTAPSPVNREEMSLPAPVPPAQGKKPPGPAAPPKALPPVPRAATGMPDAVSKHEAETPAYAPPPPAHAPAPLSTPSAAAPATAYPLPAPDSRAADEWIESRREAELLSRRYREDVSRGMMQKRAMSDGTRYSTQSSGGGSSSATAPREPWSEQQEPSEQMERPGQAARPERVEVSLRVNDPAGAVRAIEEAVTRSGGRIVRRVYGEASHLLFVQVGTGKAPELMGRLERIGTLQRPPLVSELEDGTVDLSIRW
ncbi:DUF2275 domain-containing protein [Geotalea uraniireducens]|uniref:Putative transmembrane anti-sigma factor n=1 Tax=Geotalea uraniireducens (strain Rf4) TaxID=351605 RepID=A5GDN0_GEOUR|nr:DUF2275 domain-containing protein [Geotalea uraniireducens]ABQ24316.1 putative transmembrane anti-sigma factor [Geotalea uraniireducens Rf4]